MTRFGFAHCENCGRLNIHYARCVCTDQQPQRRTRRARVRCTFFGGFENADWEAECNGHCAHPLSLGTPDWASAYEAAVGHICVQHGAGR